MNTQSVGNTTSRSRALKAARAAALLLTLPLAACLKSVNDPGTATKYGAITVTGFPNGSAVRATARAIFFPAYSVAVPNSRVTSNACQFAAVDTNAVVSQGLMKAGTALGLIAGSGAGASTLSLDYDIGTVSYNNPTVFGYSAGDSVAVTIPGDAAGYPAASIKVRLAEPLLVPDVTVPAVGGTMPIRWNTGDSTSAIIMTLKYANPSTSRYANEQVVCTLIDDGAEDLTAAALVNFNNSPVDLRSLKMTRWRTQLTTPVEGSVLHIVSTVDTLVRLK